MASSLKGTGYFINEDFLKEALTITKEIFFFFFLLFRKSKQIER